jgi:tetratricopeptide (TPR) repeat protein
MMRFYGIFLSRIGHAKEALATFAAGTLDPLDSDSWVDQAWVYSNVGRYEDSIVAAKKSLELAPEGQVYGWQFLGDSLIELGKVREGLAVLAKMPPDTPQRLSGEIDAYQKLGDQTAADRKMAELRRVSGDAVDTVLARFYARQGKFEPALQALERAWAARDPWLIDLPITDALKPLHNEPRFKAIWNAIDFP